MTEEVQKAIDQVHAAHIIIMKEMERICKKHHIMFYIESGTLLGAIRHKAAIPWDDDADTAMLRSEFEKFRKIVREELAPGFAYVEPKDLGNNAIFDFVPRIILLDSQIQPEDEEQKFYGNGMNNHVSVDIFIIDDVNDCNWMHLLSRALILVCYGLGMGHRYQLDMNDYNGLSRLVVKILSGIGKHIPSEKIIQWYDKASRMGTGKNKKKHRCFYGNFLIQDVALIYDKRWFAETVPVTLNGVELPAPKGWHRALKTIYGDYMQLPPEEKRVNTHCNPDYVKIWYQEKK